MIAHRHAAAVALCAAAAFAALADDRILLRNGLWIGQLGRSGRVQFPTDAMQDLLARNAWSPPAAGQTISDKSWDAAAANDDGWFEGRQLQGGYLYVPLDMPGPRTMILAAAGHSMVYVNGTPLAGDIYALGFMHVPVSLHAGRNDLLFAVSRGRLRAELFSPPAPAYLRPDDATLPDLIADERAYGWAGHARTYFPGSSANPRRAVAAVMIVNASAETLRAAKVGVRIGPIPGEAVSVPPVAPLTFAKVPVTLPEIPADADLADAHFEFTLTDAKGTRLADPIRIPLAVRKLTDVARCTFLSDIDGSVQYFALRHAENFASSPAEAGLLLTLHGASVEATSQAAAYARKTAMHIVAPTNRRPYGFDWEDWGRLDAIEVLDLATRELRANPRRTWLSGHSMGGHGTWHLGVTFPDRFAAIAPSAGWVSMWSYAGAQAAESTDPLKRLLARCASPSDTLALLPNLADSGVYVLHGDRDDNVPVDQARTMRSKLAEFHSDFVYYERPGAGHWWGNDCVDWPPLIDFLQRHELPENHAVRRVRFTTASPHVSAKCRYATIEQQIQPLSASTIELEFDREKRALTGKTTNVARLTIDARPLPADATLAVELDGAKRIDAPLDAAGMLRLERVDDAWRAAAPLPSAAKNPARCGPFKDAFRHRFCLVYPTNGTEPENRRGFEKARFDAQTWSYRANGYCDLVADREFNPDAHRDRSIILYGNAQSNAAWRTLLADSPIQVNRGAIRIGERDVKGEDLACLMIRPRPGSDFASVGVIAATGEAGMRATERLPVFLSGVAYPDFLLFDAAALLKSDDAVRCAGFFADDWSLNGADAQWRAETPDAPP